MNLQKNKNVRRKAGVLLIAIVMVFLTGLSGCIGGSQAEVRQHHFIGMWEVAAGPKHMYFRNGGTGEMYTEEGENIGSFQWSIDDDKLTLKPVEGCEFWTQRYSKGQFIHKFELKGKFKMTDIDDTRFYGKEYYHQLNIYLPQNHVVSLTFVSPYPPSEYFYELREG